MSNGGDSRRHRMTVLHLRSDAPTTGPDRLASRKVPGMGYPPGRWRGRDLRVSGDADDAVRFLERRERGLRDA